MESQRTKRDRPHKKEKASKNASKSDKKSNKKGNKSNNASPCPSVCCPSQLRTETGGKPGCDCRPENTPVTQTKSECWCVKNDNCPPAPCCCPPTIGTCTNAQKKICFTPNASADGSRRDLSEFSQQTEEKYKSCKCTKNHKKPVDSYESIMRECEKRKGFDRNYRSDSPDNDSAPKECFCKKDKHGNKTVCFPPSPTASNITPCVCKKTPRRMPPKPPQVPSNTPSNTNTTICSCPSMGNQSQSELPSCPSRTMVVGVPCPADEAEGECEDVTENSSLNEEQLTD